MKRAENKKTDPQFTTPILFIIFNSPETTARVFERIRQIKPSQLFIAADGPRREKKGEKERCEAARKIVAAIDWPCEVARRYSEINQGCRIGASSAVTWFFENVEEGIILEDDCLPDISFFGFCQELLSYYRENNSIKMICGSNFQFGKSRIDASYFFSNFPQLWGWATWRRAWQEYDIDMTSYPSFKKEKGIKKVIKDKKVQKYWTHVFDSLYDKNNKIDTWDGQWAYSIFTHNGLSVIANQNLISNIGYGEDATHTKKVDIFSNIPTVPLLEIIHPPIIAVSEEADAFYFRLIYKNIFQKIFLRLNLIWRKFLL